MQRRHGGRGGHDGVGDGDGGDAPRPERAPRPGVRLPDGRDRGARRRGVPQPGRHALLDRLPHARRQRQDGLLRRARRGRRGGRGEVTHLTRGSQHVPSCIGMDIYNNTHVPSRVYLYVAVPFVPKACDLQRHHRAHIKPIDTVRNRKRMDTKIKKNPNG
jgi:hypothetical protein